MATPLRRWTRADAGRFRADGGIANPSRTAGLPGLRACSQRLVTETHAPFARAEQHLSNGEPLRLRRGHPRSTKQVVAPDANSAIGSGGNPRCNVAVVRKAGSANGWASHRAAFDAIHGRTRPASDIRSAGRRGPAEHLFRSPPEFPVTAVSGVRLSHAVHRDRPADGLERTGPGVDTDERSVRHPAG